MILICDDEVFDSESFKAAHLKYLNGFHHITNKTAVK